MSRQLSTIAQIDFDAQVKAAYQSAGLMRPHVRVKMGVVGATAEFRRAGSGLAQPRQPQSDVSVMNVAYAKISANMADWAAAEYVDNLDQMLVNFDERAIIVNNVGAAIGRRMDQVVVDAMVTGVATPTIAVGSSGLTFDKLRAAKRILDSRSVPMERRKLVVSARGMDDILGEAKFTSSDYVERGVIRDGRIERLMGFDILMMDDRTEGGLPLDSTTRTCFAFDEQAIGLAIGAEPPIEINYIPEKTSWLICQVMKLGAVAIDTQGIIRIATQEA